MNDELDRVDQTWMGLCLYLAEAAARRGEIPVGAVLVKDNRLIGQGFNLREMGGDPSAHAEILALRQAAQHTERWRLAHTTLYVTMEPCPMCAGALINARVKRVVYGCLDEKGGAVDSLYRLLGDPRLNHRIEVRGGVRAEECAQLLKDFFAARRPAQKS